MNGTELKGDPPLKMFVGRAQKKLERQAELRRQHETIKNERYQRFQGANLYVKNIEESVDEEQLCAAFNKFGPLNSVKVCCLFVCFAFSILFFTGDAR
jgi:polyadenylate-binding protein